MNLVQAILTAFITSVFIENVVVVRFLGICSFLGVSKKTETAVGMGSAVVFVMTIASAATWGIQQILDRFGLGYLQTLTFILVIAFLVQLVEMIFKKTSQNLYKALGVYLPLITTNCAVLGIAIQNIVDGLSFSMAVLTGAFAGFGYMVAIVLFSGIRERQESAEIAGSLEGFPSSMIASALISLAFLGFTGMTF